MSSNNSLVFGSGVLFATPAGVNQTPVQFGTLQNVSIDFGFPLKELHGQFQMPVAIGRGKGKITGKASFANIESAAFNTIFFGVAASAGQTKIAFNEAGAIPGTPFGITVSNSATWQEDKGVVFAATGIPMTRVASAPTANQYSVAAGVYTFAAADTGKAVLISYSYTNASGGFKSTITNPLMGVAPTFQIDLLMTNPNVVGAQSALRLYSCIAAKLSIDTKIDDFMIPDFEFGVFANAANNIGEMHTAA